MNKNTYSLVLLLPCITVFLEKTKFVDVFVATKISYEQVYSLEMLHNISNLPLSRKFALTCDITTR